MPIVRWTILSALASLTFGAVASVAQEGDFESDELVRLPSTSVPVEGAPTLRLRRGERLIPGGNLLLTFDTDRDGQIARAELESGIAGAFALADANGDGGLSPLEQIRWAEGLPTYDATLANPVRFDPNLDRRVSAAEFASIVVQLAAGVTDAQTGVIDVNRLREKARGAAQEAPAVSGEPREVLKSRSRRGSGS